ncbi:MAG: hypothetical protein ROZ37_02795 [Aromatoleum sp.]|jgi:hypothetical protein|nr:hypothetical protein [Aromatoleum sp.]MDT3669244.1 hypothetical protein [Aromatoleum sp.]
MDRYHGQMPSEATPPQFADLIEAIAQELGRIGPLLLSTETKSVVIAL